MIKKLLVTSLAVALCLTAQAKSYSSGSHSSYSHSSSPSHSSSYSHSSSPSHSSSYSSSSKGYSSGKSYSSGLSSKGYSSSGSFASKSSSSGSGYGGKIYSSGSQNAFSSKPKSSSFSYDTGAASAQKEVVSQRDFQSARAAEVRTPSSSSYANSSRPSQPKTYANSSSGSYSRPSTTRWYSYRQPAVIINQTTYQTRPYRTRTYYSSYYGRPVAHYNDYWSDYYWLWLLDQDLETRAQWAYNYRNQMDAERYRALLASDPSLAGTIAQLEAQKYAANASYVPRGMEADLMYSDQYVNQTYNNRTTAAGAFCFWLFALALAAALIFMFVYLVFVKRWN